MTIRFVFAGILFLFTVTAYGQKDSSKIKSKSQAPKAAEPKVSVTSEKINWNEYFIVTVSKDSLKATLEGKNTDVGDSAQLDVYIANNIQKINPDKVAIRYPINAPFQMVQPVFSIFGRHKILRFKLITVQ